jgi:dTDP-4-amino-4,6-dideoxygalactose transaminase
MSTDSRLAILGGTPVRDRPFLVEPMIDQEEERLVLEAVRERSFSRYIGSATPDIEKVLRLASREAAEITDYWHFLGGPHVRAFAAEFAATFGVPFAIPINAATTGLSVSLAACAVGPGDEVIVPAISYTATGTAPLMYHAIPVFVDVDPLTFCLDARKLEAAITPRTRAIMVVHLTGNVADMDAILDIARRHRLRVVEDAAQAIGATWRDRKAGTLGDAGVFSFQQSKNIMTGEGGMIVTRDAEIARRCRLILNHGEVVFDDDSDPADMVNMVGFNFRMPELCAAVGRAQLRKLERVNDWRTRNADILREELSGLDGIRLPPSQRHGNGPARDVPHLFVALYDRQAMGIPRQLFVAALREEGVPVGTGYVRPMYANPMFLKKVGFGTNGTPWREAEAAGSRVEYRHGMCPEAETLLGETFLWFYHIAYSSTEEDMRDIGRAVRKVVTQRERLSANAERLRDKLGGHSAGRIGVAPAQLKGSVR